MVADNYDTYIYVSWQDEERREKMLFPQHISCTILDMKKAYASDDSEISKMRVFRLGVEQQDDALLEQGWVYRLWWHSNVNENSYKQM